MSSAENNSITEHFPTEQEFCRTAATTAALYDHSFITRFPIPTINVRNAKITPQRYSQLQQDIESNIECHTEGMEPNPPLLQLKQDITKAFQDGTIGYSYPVSNPVHTVTIDPEHQQPARFNLNTVNTNNPTISLDGIHQILALPRSKLMEPSSLLMNKEEKSMDIDEPIPNGTASNRKKITPLKRKLTEIIDDDEESSPYRTPQPVKRRKLTHRSSSLAMSQTPFLQKSMSLSQTSMDLDNHNTHSNSSNAIPNVEAHLNAFCGRFRDCMEDIPLGHINIEKASECDQMSWMTVRSNIESLAQCHQIQSVQVNTLSQLLCLIDKQLCCVMESDLIHPPNLPFPADVDNVAKGIQAGIIALYIMTAKDIHRSLIQEDVLCKIMRMITFHIAHNFTPCKDIEQRSEYKQYFNHKIAKKCNKKRKKKSKKKQKATQEEETTFWRDINIQMNGLYADFCSALLLLMNIYTEKELIREQHMTQLLNCCFTTFDMRNMDDIQDGCKAIIVTVFVQYEAHRQDIIARIMDYYRNTERTYFAKRKIANESKDKDTNYIHLINMLILEICQCLSCSMLLSHGSELRQIQLMNTPHAKQQRKQRIQYRRSAAEKEMTQSTKHELFEQCIMKPMNDCKHTLNNIIKGIVTIVMDTKNKGDKLVMFYKDLENVWDLTEWPIAEYALTVTLGAFHSYLTSKHFDNNKQFKPFRPYFIAGLASICATARLAKKMGQKNKIHCTAKSELNEKQLDASMNGNGHSDPLADGERIDCKCGSNKKTPQLNHVFMIDCDDCHSWSHGPCVGIKGQSEVPSHWICDGCRINREIEQQLMAINAKHAATNNDQESYDEATKLHILLINYLSKQLPESSWYIPLASSHELSARQFHVIQWLYWRVKSTQKDKENDDTTHLVTRLFSDYFIMPLQSQLKTLPTFSDYGIHRVNMQLALSRRLIALHESMIYFIASDLQNTASKSRTKALKSLKEICDVDASILKQQNISDRVIEKFKDKSAAVREAAVDLVGHFVIYDDDDHGLICVYFKDLKLRIIDNAVSVRKRVIRIFRQICLKSPSNPLYSEICLCLFNKMSERNESIKKLVANTFEEMWFSSDSQMLRNRIYRKSHRGGNNRFTLSFIRLVEQIIASISSSQKDDEVCQYLIDLICQMLQKEEKKSAAAQHKSDADKSRVFEICDDMVCVLIDKLKQCDEDAWCEMKPLMDSLYIFCKVRPAFVTSHFVCLTSYVTPPPKSNTAHHKTALHVLKTLAQVLTTMMPLIDRSQITKASQTQLQKQMIKILWNCELSIDLIYDGVYCDMIQSLCCLVQHLSKDYKFITNNIFDLCCGALTAKQHNAIWNKTKKKVHKFSVIRSLIFLGCATKYFDVDRYITSDLSLDIIYDIYLFFLQNNEADFEIFHQYAIQGFIPLFCRKPSLMIREETIDIIRSYLNDRALSNMSEKTEFLQQECLNALHQFFETEERRTQLLQNNKEHKIELDIVESDAELSEIDESDQEDISGMNQDIAGIRTESSHDTSDTGDLIHFITTLSPCITRLCSSSSSTVRNNCCQILLDWTTSLWNSPLEYLKQIIALCLDPSDEKTRNMALIAFHKIIHRTPTLFNMNLMAGIIQCFKLSHYSLDAMFVDYDGTKDIINKKMIEHVFVDHIPKIFGVLDQMTKSKQQQIMSSITRSIIGYMDFSVCCKKKIMKQKKHYSIIPMFIAFLCHFLCAIPFETYKPSEPYAVIQSLDHLLKNNMRRSKDNIQSIIRREDLYEYSCHALMCLILYEFRSFWCKLYNLNEQNIGIYKLTATGNNNNKHKEKTFKARKEQDKTSFFVFKSINGVRAVMEQLDALYESWFVGHNQVNVIPEVLTQISSAFTKIWDEYMMMEEQYTQSDQEEEKRSEMDEDEEEIKTKKKKKKKKAKRAKPKPKKKAPKRGRKKKKKKIFSDEEEDDEDEEMIVYADTSSDDDDTYDSEF